MKDMKIREATYKEYKDFSKKIHDKVQLGESNSVFLLEGNYLVGIKLTSSILKDKDNFLSIAEFDELSIEGFNSGVLKEKEIVKVVVDFYKGKNFIIK